MDCKEGSVKRDRESITARIKRRALRAYRHAVLTEYNEAVRLGQAVPPKAVVLAALDRLEAFEWKLEGL